MNQTVTGSALEQKINAGDAVFGVVGLGYVGLPLIVAMAERSGSRCIGFDISEKNVQKINSGTSHIGDISDAELTPLVQKGLIEATVDFSRTAGCDVMVICVPTPLNAHGEPDVSHMVSAANDIAPYLKSDILVVLESTTYPGTTEEVLLPLIEGETLKLGNNLFVAFSPERVDPGNETWKITNTPKVVGGVDERSTELATLFYSKFIDTVVPVSTARAAELSKLFENIFRGVNIALVNELAQLCERMDIDIWEVIDAAKTKPFGFMPFYPGPGLGGHCIPIDPFYLSWKAREYDFHTQFIELAGRINEDMPYYVARRLMDALNTQGKALNGARILALGVAYKADIDDMRESPAMSVIARIEEKGAQVRYHDPHVPQYTQDGKKVHSVDLTAEELQSADAVIVLSGHSNVDYRLVAEQSSLILDTRNVFGASAPSSVIKL
ncbi:MAG: nucleotide sugar dehydrogenase [Coriobacteriia bacterium]|nr:nucleotide sugar dehydrogenase [Coriobacteriia bacterium]MCL2870619.1 nucleotide sugar dehydrogenase [Coriobacteriia bacterium]